MSYPTILEIVPGSPAAVVGLAVGDELLSVNGVTPSDVIEYQQLVDEPELVLNVRRGSLDLEIDVAKDDGAPLGVRLNSSIFDRVQTCDNHCEFCFIYQLPSGMRTSLYLKDDDYRLSFLYGNFTTLTRFTELDLARVVEERLGPLYVSIHATDPDVRSRMLRNPRGATSLRWLRALLDNGVTVHGQVVLCPGVNGGEVLGRTCAEILLRYEAIASVGIVPLGVSQFNTESTLEPHTKETAQRDLAIIEFWQNEALRRTGRRLFFASDELYLMAETPIPPVDVYEDFPQHENGIGMIRAFYEELDRIEFGTPLDRPTITGEWRSIPAAPDEGYRATRHPGAGSDLDRPEGDEVVIVTSEYGAAALAPVLDRIERLAGRRARLLPVHNRFFEGNIAVAGLLVGADIRDAVAADEGRGDAYVVPDVALSGDQFLDGMHLDELQSATVRPIVVAETTAGGLLKAITP